MRDRKRTTMSTMRNSRSSLRRSISLGLWHSPATPLMEVVKTWLDPRGLCAFLVLNPGRPRPCRISAIKRTIKWTILRIVGVASLGLLCTLEAKCSESRGCDQLDRLSHQTATEHDASDAQELDLNGFIQKLIKGFPEGE